MNDLIDDGALGAVEHERLTDILDAYGVMPTPQRLEIARILFSRRQHLSADQILRRAHEAGMAVSKATVYNTLGLFAQKGLVREVIVDPVKVFYDSNTSPHHHIYDVSTCRLTDIEGGEIEVSGLPALPTGTEVAGVDVIVRVRSREG